MKKNYVYFIAPLAGLAIFTGIYWQYSATYENRLLEMHRREVEATQKKLDEDSKNRKIAADTAFASQEKRKADKKAKDAKDSADKDAREYDSRRPSPHINCFLGCDPYKLIMRIVAEATIAKASAPAPVCQ